MSLPVGKFRALQQLSNNGIFKIVAIDHRDVFVDMLKKAGKPYDVISVREEKLEVILSSKENVSGFLVDPIYALPMCIYSEAIPSHLGFMISYEDNDYSVSEFSKHYFIKGLSVNNIREFGASALKLFFFYNPRSQHAKNQEQVIDKLSKDCVQMSMPLLIEPILYSLKEEGDSREERSQLIFEMLIRLSKFSVDIFKIEFPGEINCLTKDQNLAVCEKVSDILQVPWVLMSSGVGIEVFSRQLEIACEGGASGYIVGRALWREFVQSKGERVQEKKQIQQRLTLLSDIADLKARKWTSFSGLVDFEFDQTSWFRDENN